MVKKKTKKTNFTDVFDGELIHIWKDNELELYTFATPFATLTFGEEMWTDFKRDLDKLAEL